MADSPICTIPGCGKGGKLRCGMCNPHYRRWKRHGDPLAGNRYPQRGEPMRYLLAHMWDVCPKWPFSRGRGGYGHIQHEGKVVDVHRLVCEMVNGLPPTPEHQAAHNCGKGHEGCFGARCVEWKTAAANTADCVAHGTMSRGEQHPITKLTEDQVRVIRAAKGKVRQEDIAALFGISRPHVSEIQTGASWRWLE